MTLKRTQLLKTLKRNLKRNSITEYPKEDPITEGPQRTLSLRTLNRTLSLSILKRTLSLRTLKGSNQTPRCRLQWKRQRRIGSMGSKKSRFLVQRFEGGPQISIFLKAKFRWEILCQFVTNISGERIFKWSRFQYKRNFMKLTTFSVAKN